MSNSINPLIDFSNYDHAIDCIHRIRRDSTTRNKTILVINQQLCSNSDHVTLKTLNQDNWHKWLKIRGKEILSPPVQACLRKKEDIYQKKIQKHFAETWHQYLSFFQVFTLWMEDLVALYRLHDPDDASIDKLERELYFAVAMWRYKEVDQVNKKRLEDALEAILSKVQEVAPDEQQFLSMKKSYQELLCDTCEGADHWDPDVHCRELGLYFSQDYKDNVNANRIYFHVEILPREFDALFKGRAKLALANWHKVIAMVEKQYDAFYQTALKLNQTIASVKDRSRHLSFITSDKEDIDYFLKQTKEQIPKALNTIIETPLVRLDECQDSILALRAFIIAYNNEPYFTVTRTFHPDEIIVVSLTGRYENPKQIIPILKGEATTLTRLSHLIETYLTEYFYDISRDYESLLYYSKYLKEKAEKQKPKETIAQVAAPILVPTQDIETAIVVKPKVSVSSSSRVERRTVPTKVKKAVKQPKAKVKQVDEPSIPLVSFASFAANLQEGSDPSKIRFAAHADLYRHYVIATQALVERFENDPAHRKNLRRLGCLMGSYLVESTINFQTSACGKEVDTSTHNLRRLWNVTKNSTLEAAVRIFDGASYKARFTYDRARCTGNFRVEHLKEVTLDNLMNNTDESNLQNHLNTSIESIDKCALELNCSKVEKPAESPRILIDVQAPTEDMQSLMDKVGALAMQYPKNPWINQWLDDLTCLQSSLDLLDNGLSIEEYATVMAHIHFLIHSTFQSPLYALREQKGLASTRNHELVDLWIEINSEIPDSVRKFFDVQLKDACNVCRYPYRHAEPISRLHRMQLETIAMVNTYEILDGFQITNKNEATLAYSLGWTPILQKIKQPDEQAEELIEICVDLCKIQADHLLKKFT